MKKNQKSFQIHRCNRYGWVFKPISAKYRFLLLGLPGDLHDCQSIKHESWIVWTMLPPRQPLENHSRFPRVHKKIIALWFRGLQISCSIHLNVAFFDLSGSYEMAYELIECCSVSDVEVRTSTTSKFRVSLYFYFKIFWLEILVSIYLDTNTIAARNNEVNIWNMRPAKFIA